MSGVDVARSIAPAAVRGEPVEVERASVGLEPAFAEAVARIEAEGAARMAGLRVAVTSEITGVDEVAARAVSLPLPRTIALVLAYLTAAGAFAFYFSRADFDIVDIIPVAMGFVLASAVLYSLAALPVSRRRPPVGAVASAGWVLTVLTGAAVGFAGYSASQFAPASWPWVVVGGVGVCIHLVTALACAGARSHLTPEERAATEKRVVGFRDELAARARTDAAAAVAAVTEAFDALPEPSRIAIRADLDAAYAELDRRRVAYAANSDAPGTAVVRHALRLQAMAIGVQDLGFGDGR